QVGHLEVGALLGELLDGIAAVLQDAGLAVDEGHRAAARGGVDETGVVRREGVTTLDADLLEVGGPNVAVSDLDLILGPAAVVADRESVLRGVAHGHNLRLLPTVVRTRSPPRGPDRATFCADPAAAVVLLAVARRHARLALSAVRTAPYTDPQQRLAGTSCPPTAPSLVR